MVTANRSALAARAVAAFLAQSWPARELVVLDDGEEDYAPVLAAVPAEQLTYRRIARDPERPLGALRNMTLELARGEVLAQWDDDDWYHPDRLATQVAALNSGAVACVLQSSLMHLDAPDWFDHPYVGALPAGIPGSIVHRRSAIRYPELRRGEDTDYLAGFGAGVARIGGAHLFVRCFHGANTWDRTHFERRVRNTPRDAIEWAWRKWTRKPFRHSRFRLAPAEQAAFARYLADSRAVGLWA